LTIARLGAEPCGDGTTEFRVWAPNATTVSVEAGETRHPLGREAGGTFAGKAHLSASTDYWLVLDGGERLPDPCSRWQPDGLRGPSRVLDTAGFSWDAAPVALEIHDLVVYELHVGTFSPEGTFDSAIPDLPGLAEFGVTAVEVMPLGTYPGERGWGYDGVLNWAPHSAYGGPHGFARFVDAAHNAGLGVIVDAVYNHLGPGSELVSAFGPYFTDRTETPWGDALDYSASGVREWAIQNAEMWVRDYRVDGLRLDAVHAVHDEDSSVHVLAELRDRAKSLNPNVMVFSETNIADLRPLKEWRHDGIWLDSLHHHMHVLLTGERDGYYKDFGTIDGLRAELLRPHPERFVVSAQNHDQVGNRARGDRLSPIDHRIALAVVLFSTATPLLFMGEEYDETQPFRFFTDHDDPAIAAATRDGRKEEFAEFPTFADQDLPDPQAPMTFLESKLARRRPDSLYTELLALRRTLPREIHVEADAKQLRLRRGTAALTVDFAAKTVELTR
jgi:maltooligosyltrehalose trehalohydrolase